MATVLSYAGCGTCRTALAWLREHEVAHEVRPIVEAPPTLGELAQWIPKSGVAARKWLNTSGQSYRALALRLGKERVLMSTDEEIRTWLASDGKIVKRPVTVADTFVLVGFRPEVFARAFGVA